MFERLNKFNSRLQSGEMLLFDGAWGTELQKLGLQPGDCPEEWNISHASEVRNIAKSYLQAGADLVLTNTFGANKFRLVRHGQAERVGEINVAGARLTREAVGDKAFVAGDVGPTGEFLEPVGMLNERQMYEAFHDQIAALKEGGVDGICIETMYVLEEAQEAIKAARDLGVFCMACMTFMSTPQGFKTTHGTTLAECIQGLDAAGADVVGTNCGNGMAGMVAIAKEMRTLTRKPLIVKSNAGIPEIVDGKIVYQETPETMAAKIAELHAIGINIVGGCCGTTPEHIRAFRRQIDALKKP